MYLNRDTVKRYLCRVFLSHNDLFCDKNTRRLLLWAGFRRSSCSSRQNVDLPSFAENDRRNCRIIYELCGKRRSQTKVSLVNLNGSYTKISVCWQQANYLDSMVQ